MYRIVRKEQLSDSITRMSVEAPAIARKALPGQFIILMVNENGERIPMTLAGYDREQGTITLIFQQVGYTTRLLGALNEGDYISDVAGPLGEPSRLDGIRRAALVAGGLGIAIAYPQAKALHDAGACTDIILGFRSAGLILLDREFAALSDTITVMTDDGSNGHKGYVTQALKSKLELGAAYDTVIAIGPLPMMKAVCDLTRAYLIPTTVSMNPIIIDGTGMCGGCRVTVDGVMKFACVDGPDFNGHLVDFDEAIRRNRMYSKHEALMMHRCKLSGA
jgi:ferredoxin--NADP+ reductase